MKRLIKRCVFCAGLCCLVFLVLPSLLSLLVLPRLFNRLPVQECGGRIWWFSPWTLLGDVVVRDGTTGLHLPHIVVHFSPLSILQRRVLSLELDSATMDAEILDSRLRFLPSLESYSSLDSGAGESPFFPLSSLFLKNCHLRLHTETGVYRLTVNGSVHSIVRKLEEGRPVLTGKVRLDGGVQGEVQIESRRDGAGSETRLVHRISFASDDLSWLHPLLPAKSSVEDGRLALSGTVWTRGGNLIEKADTLLTLHGKFISDNSVVLGTGQNGLVFHLGGQGANWTMHLEGLSLLEPQQGKIFADISLNSGSRTFTGDIHYLPSSPSKKKGAEEKNVTFHMQGAVDDGKLDMTYHLSTRRLVWQNRLFLDLPEMQGNLSLQGKKLVLSGRGMAKNSPLSFSCEGDVEGSDTGHMNCRLAETEISTDNLAHSLSLPTDLVVHAKLSAFVACSLGRRGIATRGELALQDGSLHFKQLHLDGVGTTLTLSDLLAMRSQPGQVLSLAKIQAGSLSFSNATISYRLDGPERLFLETFATDWCGGRVEGGAIALVPAQGQVKTTLYCDRLGFAALLGQLGVAEAEGDGTLNGRFPLEITRTGVQFDDGILFSTPGAGGVIRFTSTDVLQQGLVGVENSPHLEYSLRALHDFFYDWTKLRFTTEGNDLLLVLQLKGKPAVPLPYAFKRGQLVEDDDGALQYPVQFDVNVRLPSDDIFRYGRGFRSPMEKR